MKVVWNIVHGIVLTFNDLILQCSTEEQPTKWMHTLGSRLSPNAQHTTTDKRNSNTDSQPQLYGQPLHTQPSLYTFPVCQNQGGCEITQRLKIF